MLRVLLMITSIVKASDGWLVIVQVGNQRMEIWSRGSKRDARQSAMEAISQLMLARASAMKGE